MSLINDMLRDLERRQRPAAADALGGLLPAGGEGGRSRRFIVAVLAPVLVATAVLAGWRLGWLPTDPQAAPAPVATTAPATAQPRPPAQPPLGNELSAIEVRSVEGRLELILAAKRAARHRLSSEGGRVSLLLQELELAAGLPDLASEVPSLQAADLRREGEGVRLELEFARPVRVQSSWAEEAGGARLRLTVILPEPAAPVQPAAVQPAPMAAVPVKPVPAPVKHQAEAPEPAPAPAVAAAPVKPAPAAVKRAPEPDPARRAARNEAEARRRLEAGRPAAAVEAYRAALALEPERESAQRGLLAALLATGREAEAETLLRGIEPARPWRAEALARLLMQREQAAEAAAALEAALPQAADEAGYLALLAAVYQRLGRHQDAAELYLGLVRLAPDRGVWWMGLALALEGQGEPARARDAYRRALRAGGLDAEVESYVRGRLQALGER